MGCWQVSKPEAVKNECETLSAEQQNRGCETLDVKQRCETLNVVEAVLRVLYRLECGLSSGPACTLLGVFTFPWGRVMDTREKESPLILLQPEGEGQISYLGLGVWNT
ncbi:hypothetical protein CRG98_003727 [Punica granatum]|uniref:Uncharacterized protein n=1 Tax=Punica granatum TaxID=22663 RepID=A0A2I0L542_PUNGR|nr:hypothetical protein CRG98_003727 [Punica granatum]